MPAPDAPSSMRRDVLSAYLASGAKILGWIIVSGLVYRFISIAAFSILALIRGTLGILNYTSLGLSPAMIRLLAEQRSATNQAPLDDPTHGAPAPSLMGIYSNGLLIALASGIAGLIVTIAYAIIFPHVYGMPDALKSAAPWVVLWMGCGTMLRLMGDAPGAMLQANRFISRDNARIAEGELVWIFLSLFIVLAWPMHSRSIDALIFIAGCYTISGALAMARRGSAAKALAGLLLPRWHLVDRRHLRRLIAFGFLVLFAQLADYFYAPTDYILINNLLGWEQVAIYTPAMQIDAGLLLLVAGLSNVILPKTALAHTAGQIERVKRYYLLGTLFSAILLLLSSAIAWLLSPILFRAWLGNPMPATQFILPLVLIHTVVGGSSSVGRSILLGMGKVRPFTIAVLIAGGSNVVLSFIFVRYLHLGLDGIIYGTIAAVIGRCMIWMPWYVLRSLRQQVRIS